MKYTVDFKECLKDSPKFRTSVEDAESDIEALEVRLDRLVKQCTSMIDMGKSFSNASSTFVLGVRDLANYFNDDALVSGSLNRFAHAMSEMLKYFNILMDQANRSICKNLSSFIKTDIKKVKESKKLFEKISDDMDAALNRNSQAPKSKPVECEEAFNTLTAMRSCFAHTSLDYVFQINVLNSKKRFDILDTMLSFMHAQNTFFHQGHDLFRDLEATYMKDIAGQVQDLSGKAKVEMKEMEERHTLVQQKELSGGTLLQQQDGDCHMTEGYLFKRNSNAFKNYVRRWFCIQDSKLVYRKRSKDTLTTMEEDLRLCNIRQPMEIDRRFCFEVLSPTRSHILQADSDEECQLWVKALNDSISKAYKDTLQSDPVYEEDSSSKSSNSDSSQTNASPPNKPSKVKLRKEQLLVIPGNSHCCDCGALEPRWASINLGITLCIECSGIHRSLGVHLSKVRSVTLDTWEPEHIKVMLELGNDVINRIYEANVDESIAVRATPTANRSIRENWIKAKYVQKAFVKPLPGINRSNKERKWSVRKKIHRRPVLRKTESSPSKDSQNSPKRQGSPSDSDDLTSGILEGGISSSSRAVLSVSKASSSQESRSDSECPVASSDDKDKVDEATAHRGFSKNPDDLVFGEDSVSSVIEGLERSFDLGSSDDSCADFEDDSSSPEGQMPKSRKHEAASEEGDEYTTSWEDMSKLDPNLLLYKASGARNLPVMVEALSNRADPNWVNLEEEGKTAIMKAVQTGSLAACEFLMLNNSKLDRKDKYGRTPLHHATIYGHTGQVCQFLKRKADQNAKDNQGKTPLTIAIDNAHADIVTLLRLANLNDEMKEADGYSYNPGDETFQDVFRDFTNMASNNPEKLKRK